MKIETEKLKAVVARIPFRTLFKYLIALGLGSCGVGLMLIGGLAWAMGEEIWLFTGFVAGAILVGAGGVNLVNCLDQVSRKATPGQS